MHPVRPEQRNFPIRRLGGVLLLWLLSLSWAAGAEDGRFDIRSAGSRLENGVYYVSARVDYRLSDEALQALNSGLDLTLMLQIEVTRVRSFLPNQAVASLQQAYVLSYQPLSQRYVVTNSNSGQHDSYVTLFSALNALGRLRHLPVIDAALLNDDDRYAIRLRAVLDKSTLPGPLRLFAFWGNSFRLESEWYSWSLKE